MLQVAAWPTQLRRGVPLLWLKFHVLSGGRQIKTGPSNNEIRGAINERIIEVAKPLTSTKKIPATGSSINDKKM